MAPELIKKLPYGLQVDCWSFGICLYMLINGKHPFSAKTQLQLSQQIVKCDFQYPSKIDSEAQDLLKKILVVNPSKRLTIQQILRHPFFSNELKQLNKQYSKLIKDFKINENHKDNSFQDASTVAEISNPEQFSLKKLGLEENIKSQKQRCQRIVTKGLKPQAYQTSKVTAKILQDLSVEVQLQGTRIQISHDGDYIKIYRKNEIQIFFFEEMPKQYQKLYCYARNIVEILRSNTILKEIHNSDGKFWLMLNQIDFYGCIKDTCFHHNLLDYQIEISKNGMNLQKIHPIDYIRHNNDKLAQEIKIYLKNQKQFLKQL